MLSRVQKRKSHKNGVGRWSFGGGGDRVWGRKLFREKKNGFTAAKKVGFAGTFRQISEGDDSREQSTGVVEVKGYPL